MTEGARIHVIDDDDAMRDSLVFLLSTAALAAEPHESAESFLAALPSDEVDCVVTDITCCSHVTSALVGAIPSTRRCRSSRCILSGSRGPCRDGPCRRGL